MKIENGMEINEGIMNYLEKNYIEHHTSYTKGYVSRRSDGYIYEYNGRFGKGYAVYSPNWNSTTYCYITYWVA